ncbi:Uncharacterized protein DAT39_011025 [Clarias magur]|uniref:Secreted protein n=1 Tax=Clarias magur TaxID=1594786 RepID=A0A8J4X2Y6_CLAMG|nr:Uncharacterized protein DAT39_011025 [Clarias magur]
MLLCFIVSSCGLSSALVATPTITERQPLGSEFKSKSASGRSVMAESHSARGDVATARLVVTRDVPNGHSWNVLGSDTF